MLYYIHPNVWTPEEDLFMMKWLQQNKWVWHWKIEFSAVLKTKTYRQIVTRSINLRHHVCMAAPRTPIQKKIIQLLEARPKYKDKL